MSAELYNGLTLAYIGDAYYELLIRNKLIKKGYGKVNDLHKKCIKYTSGEAQSGFIMQMINDGFLTEKEIEILKKGRNCNANHSKKNLDLQKYQKATGFEALIGFLYLENDLKRIDELISFIDELVKEV